MSITAYSRYRRMKLRAAWELAGMAVWFRHVGIYIAGFFAIVIFLFWANDQVEAKEEADMAATKAERAAAKQEAAWLSCLNNKGVYVDGRLFICTLADTHLARSDFK